MKKKIRPQHYLLFLAGLAGAIWFFTVYPSQDVRNSIEQNLSKTEVREMAVQQLLRLDYSVDNFTITDVSFLQNEELLDSLQTNIGRPHTVDLLKTDSVKNIKPYYWQVTFSKENHPLQLLTLDQGFNECSEGELCLRFDTKGHFIALINPTQFITENEINRSALNAVFYSSSDTGKQSVFQTVADSVLKRLLYFSINKTGNPIEQRTVAQVRDGFLKGFPYQVSSRDAKAMANYYLNQTGWETSTLKIDTLFTQSVNSEEAINVSYALVKPIVGQHLNITLQFTSAGALLSLNVEYNPVKQDGVDTELIWALARQILILLFALVLLIISFLRFRSRVIDTRPAVIAAVIIGFVVAVYLSLWTLGPIGLFAAPYSPTVNIIYFIFMGFTAAGACVAAFVLFAIGDSVTRQFWPEKLQCYDYLRQGMIFNKPVGSTLLKSVALAFALAGLWTLLLFLFPKFYFHVNHIFISHKATMAIIRLLTHSIWISFFVLVSIFYVIATWIYGKQKRKWFAALAVAIASGLFVAPLFSYGPDEVNLLIGAIFGLSLYLIFIKYDSLTLLLANILFLTLIGSAGGWIVPGSSDLIMFIGVMLIFVAITATGVFAIYFGEDEQKLTKYVPEYVFEHADEERIKQELQIARQVQQSFLPIQSPKNPCLDIAAACIPAYETGGDYYDFIELDENRVGVAIGDVSGKGIQAAFYMTFVKGLLHSLSREMNSPAEILKKANCFFYDNASKSTFISLIYGIIDVKEKTFIFARAGHNPILHLNTATNQVDELRPNGLGLGLTKDKVFDNKINEIKLSITENDLLLLYTDGITEALNEIHQFYGTDRLTEVVKEHKDESAAALISTINKEVNSFIGTAKQHDDMTTMVIRLMKVDNNEEKKTLKKK